MKPTPSTNSTSVKRTLPLLAALLLFTLFLLLSCGGFKAEDDLSLQNFKEVIKAYPEPLQDVMRPILNKNAMSLGIVYVSKNGGSDATLDGSTREKAYAAAQLKTAINEAGTVASAENPYLVLVAPGTYTISTMLNMKNHVTIAGGIAEDGTLSEDKTIFDGDKKVRVFSNSGLDHSAILYGVSIAKGMTSGNGGGMYNNVSSPILIRVTFSSNTASRSGGGMANDSSSPILTQVIFSDNTTVHSGGGMYNNASSPILTRVVFSGNSATRANGVGGGMVNSASSSPILTQVTFSGNTAADGGGMSNYGSSSILTQVTFFGNGSVYGGGGMSNYGSSGPGPTIINSIFWGNNQSQNYRKNQIYMNSGSLNIYYSIVEGATDAERFILDFGFTGTITQSGITGTDPKLTDLTMAESDITLYPEAGATVRIPKIKTGSPAIDTGLYIRENSGTYYYSTNASDWYTGFSATGLVTAATPPRTAIDLTATDITGAARTGRPDIGAYEFR